MFSSVLLTIWCLIIVSCVFLLIKNENTGRKRFRIIVAIENYYIEHIDTFEFLDMYDHMEHYNSTLFRLWDWGYENILPKEDFELIKPYIEGAKR